jgi:hypothetical protein
MLRAFSSSSGGSLRFARQRHGFTSDGGIIDTYANASSAAVGGMSSLASSHRMSPARARRRKA